jgi:hypothetical protein
LTRFTRRRNTSLTTRRMESMRRDMLLRKKTEDL